MASAVIPATAAAVAVGGVASTADAVAWGSVASAVTPAAAAAAAAAVAQVPVAAVPIVAVVRMNVASGKWFGPNTSWGRLHVLVWPRITA